ncbi:hypothetical protein [Flavitalea sp.]|nr:hypothetical protein [Flavitalea sp.]
MLKKIIFTLALVTCVSVLPSYTNTCAKPDAAFLKTGMLKSCDPETVSKPVRKMSHGLEVFPLELISIQL